MNWRKYAVRECRIDGTVGTHRLIEAETAWLALLLFTGHAGQWLRIDKLDPDDEIPEVSFDVALVVSESPTSADLRHVGTFALTPQWLQGEA